MTYEAMTLYGFMSLFQVLVRERSYDLPEWAGHNSGVRFTIGLCW